MSQNILLLKTFLVHTLPGNNKSDPSVLEITLKKYFPLQREMYVKFNICIFFQLTKKLHASVSGLLIDGFVVTRKLHYCFHIY